MKLDGNRRESRDCENRSVRERAFLLPPASLSSILERQNIAFVSCQVFRLLHRRRRRPNKAQSFIGLMGELPREFSELSFSPNDDVAGDAMTH